MSEGADVCENQVALVQQFDVENSRTSTHHVSQPTSENANTFHTSQAGHMQTSSPTFIGKRVTEADVGGG
jgi:hypothetical protein